ncbi:hypothetical protein BGZ82_010087 [Podila clonocystis]|nr:hypothetical protein BGZ82_010087 [Podila clonocystis]
MKDDKNSNKAPSVPNGTSQPPPTADTTMDLARRDSPPAYTSGLVSPTKEAPPEPNDKEQPSPPTQQCFGGSFGFGGGSFGWGNKKSTTPSVGHSFGEKSLTTTTSAAPPAVGDPSDQRSSTVEEASLPIIPSEDNKVTPKPYEPKEDRVQTFPNSTTGSSPPQSSSTGATTPGASYLALTPPETADPTFAPSTPTYGAPPTAPLRKYICGEFLNNLGAFPVDLHKLPIADWCTPDSEFASPRDLPYAEAHAHDWSMDEQWMRTHWHPKRYLRSQTEDCEDVEIPIRNTTARLVDMMPCKEYEDMALFVPVPRDKYRPCEERNWAFGFGSVSGAGMGRWGSNTTVKSSSTLPRAFETPGQNLGQEIAKTKMKKKGSSSENDKEVIIISDGEVEEAIKFVVKVEKRKPTSTSTKPSSETSTSIVRDGKVRAREPSSSSSSTSSSSSRGEILDDKSYQTVTSKPMSHKKQRKMERAVKRAHKKSKSKHSPLTEKEQEYEKKEQEHLESEEHVTQEEEQKKEKVVSSSIPITVQEHDPEDLEGGRGASGAASRQKRRGPQDKAVGACLRYGCDDHANATRSASRSSIPLHPSSTKPDPAPSEPLALPEVAAAALVSLVDRTHHPLEDWWAVAMAQMDKLNAYFSLPFFGARAAAPGRTARNAPEQAGAFGRGGGRGGKGVSGAGPEGEREQRRR